ncbi:HEPN/Toprim-associated domain-containing protein [Catellatospora sichuanensis]|uniref:HEPN/Toprim-associated domain-containing protein n=1 Tax=Catellatospora sichuanensis TaxID=1969805 RepID=UPI001182425B|nr:HEPN/Toprim-associated domain-containing protein [Catellatospora sichuanensis]
MGHNTYVTFGSHSFMWTRGYDTEVVALFLERDRLHVPAAEDGDDYDQYGYFVTARELRQRLQVKGFTSVRARREVSAGIVALRDEKLRALPEVPEAEQWEPADVDDLIAAARRLMTRPASLPYRGVGADALADEYVERLYGRVETPSLLRLLLEAAPEDMLVGHDLHELLGCCHDMDPHMPWAASARTEQLRSTAVDAPLIVLTEGSTDSRLLSLAMSVTHPHLEGFVTFIDFAGTEGAEGGVGALAKTVSAFIAAGVANRFIALADNDTEGHAGLRKLKNGRLPPQCRVMHYPDLDLLTSYPTTLSHAGQVTLEDVNGRAGALELYLGRDVLTINGQLVPVQWAAQDHHSMQRRHGSLPDHVKKKIQQAFRRKVKRTLNGEPAPTDDWTGIAMIMDQISCAFE